MDKLLLTFLEIFRTGSLTTAAKRLNITQPSLTKRLQQLEDIYGIALFERGVSGAKPTPAGLALVTYAERIESEAHQSHEAVKAVRDRRMEVLRVGAGPLFHLRHLCGPLLTIRKAFPETRLELVTGLYRDSMADLERFRLDIVFGAHEAHDLADQLHFVPMTEVEQGVALRMGHPLSNAGALDAPTLSGLEWILYGKQTEDAVLLNGFFKRAGIPVPSYRFLTSSFTAGLQTVAGSDAAMMVPIELAPALPVAGLALHKTSPAIALMPAGGFLRRATLEFEIVAALLQEVQQGISG